MDLSPRNQFNCRLGGRYWDIPTAVPQATHFNAPIGTRYCDQLGFLCHPQKYQTFHGGNYKDVEAESKLLYSLDYYNPYDVACDTQAKRMMDCVLLQQDFWGRQNPCLTQSTPKMFHNHTKLHKYNMPV